MAGYYQREVLEPRGKEKVAGLAGMYFALAYSYVYINCAVLPTAGVLVVYAWDVAERTAAARAQFRREVETRRAYRAARAAEYGA